MNSKIVKYIFNSLAGISGIGLTLLLLLNNSVVPANIVFIVCSVIASLLFFFFMTPRALVNDFVLGGNEPKRYLLLGSSILITAAICVDLVTTIDIIYVLWASIVILFVMYYFLKSAMHFYSDFCLKENKKFFVISSLLVSALVVIQFSVYQFSFLQYDFINSMDSYYVYDIMFRNVTYFDIRHPLYSVFAYPAYATFNSLLKIFNVETALFLPIFLQLVNGQLFVLSALLLEKIFNNSLIKYYFICSSPVIINLFYFEKASIVLFLFLLSIYLITTNSEKKDTAVILASGTSLTSCLIAFCYLFRKGKDLIAKLEELILLLVKAVFFYIALGKIFIFTDAPSMLAKNIGYVEESSILEKFFSYTNMIAAGFVSTKPVFTNNGFRFVGITENINVFGTIVLILSIVLLILGIKKLENKISLFWIGFSLIFFIVLGWSISESPLFSFYFSWPFLATTINGTSYLLKRNNVSDEKVKLVHGVLIATMLVINIATSIFMTVNASPVWTFDYYW